MAVPTFTAAGTVAAGAGNITPTVPAGTLENDILVMLVETSVPGTVTPPTNWAHVTGSPLAIGSDARGTWLWRRAATSEPDPTIVDTGDHQIARIIGVRGCITTGNPWSGTPGATTGARLTGQTIPSTTSLVDDCLVVVAIIGDVPDSDGTAAFTGWTNANLTGLTERVDNHTSAGDGGAIGMATGGLATAGASGTTAVTVSVAATTVMYSMALAPETTVDPEQNEDVSIPIGETFRFRVELQETAGTAVAQAYQLRFSKNAGAYTQVTTGTDLRPVATAAFTDGAATTDLLTAGTGTFVAGEGDEVDAVSASISIGASGQTELEYALVIDTATVGDTFDLRVYKNDGSPLDTYTVTPRVTALVGAGAITAKAGVATGGTLARGTDVFEATETGVATSDTNALGADVFEATEVGKGVAGSKATGADVFEAVETGKALSAALAAGTSQKLITYEKAGTATAGTIAKGTDVFEATEAGTAISASKATGADVAEHSRTNTATAGSKALGADVSEFTENGTATAGTTARGSAQAGFTSKLGTAATGSLALGSDVFTATETGTAASGTFATASNVWEVARAGRALSQAWATGTSTKVSPTTYQKTGTATAGTRVTGADVYTASETGTVTARVTAKGTGAAASAIARWHVDSQGRWGGGTAVRWEVDPSDRWEPVS